MEPLGDYLATICRRLCILRVNYAIFQPQHTALWIFEDKFLHRPSSEYLSATQDRRGFSDHHRRLTGQLSISNGGFKGRSAILYLSIGSGCAAGCDGNRLWLTL